MTVREAKTRDAGVAAHCVDDERKSRGRHAPSQEGEHPGPLSDPIQVYSAVIWWGHIADFGYLEYPQPEEESRHEGGHA